VLGDSAYGTGEFRSHLDKSGKTAVIKPPPLRPAVPGGFTLDDFTIDEQAGTVTCPEGITVAISRNRRAAFRKHCITCPVRSRCTTSPKGRVIQFHEHHQHLVAARRQADTTEFHAVYRAKRPLVERSLAWLTRNGHRRLRFRGVERNRIAWTHRCAAINLKRLLALGLEHDGDGWAITTPA